MDWIVYFVVLTETCWVRLRVCWNWAWRLFGASDDLGLWVWVKHCLLVVLEGTCNLFRLLRGWIDGVNSGV